MNPPPAAAPNGAGAGLRRASGAVALLAALLAAYWPSLGGGALIDDAEFYFNDPLTAPQGSLAEIWLRPGLDNHVWPYYPVTRTAFWLEAALAGGKSAEVARAVNLGLHGAGALLLWWVCGLYGLRRGWWVAAAFALHPLMAQSVAWIAERKNGVALVALLLALAAFHRFERARRPANYALLAGATLLAALSKSSTLALPALYALLLLWRGGRLGLAQALWLAPLFGLSAAAAAARVAAEAGFGSGARELALTVGQKVGVAGHAAFFYASRLVHPHPLMFQHPRWEFPEGPGAHWLPAAAVALALAALWRLRGGPGRPWLFAAAAYLALLAPVAGFFANSFHRISYVAEHWGQLPALPLLAAAVEGLGRLTGPATGPAAGRASGSAGGAAFRASAVAAVAALAGLAALGWMTWKHSAHFQSESALWEHNLRLNPAAWMAHSKHGRALAARGREDEAEAHYRRALEIYPRAHGAHFNLGELLEARGRFGEAAEAFRRSFEISPQASTAGRLAGALDRAGRPLEALEVYDREESADPGGVANLLNRAELLHRLGRPEAALADYDRLAALAPELSDVWLYRGVVLQGMGRFGEAVANYDLLLERDFSNDRARVDRAMALIQLGRVPEALADLNGAVALNPTEPAYRLRRGELLAALGREGEACADHRAACGAGDCAEPPGWAAHCQGGARPSGAGPDPTP